MALLATLMSNSNNTPQGRMDCVVFPSATVDTLRRLFSNVAAAAPPQPRHARVWRGSRVYGTTVTAVQGAEQWLLDS